MEKVEALLLNYIRVCEKQELLRKTLGKGILGKYSLSEVHCIDLIGRTHEANVTRLSEKLDMTRGAISKITRKLLANGDIVSYQKPENKKEIYFHLTEQGEIIYEKHVQAHRKQENRYKAFFNELSSQEQDIMINVLEQLHSFLKKQSMELSVSDDN